MLTKAEHQRRDALFAKGLKPCSKCSQTLPLSSFSKSSTSKDGLRYWCKGCEKDYRGTHQQDHEGHLAYMRRYLQQWRKEHRREEKERHRKFAKAHPDSVRGSRKKYRQTEKGGVSRRAAQERRCATKAGLPATLTEAEWRCALEYFENRCAYCGATGVPLEQEHVIPLTKGGGYTVDNIVPACRRCNSSKQALSLGDWATGRGVAFVQEGIPERVRAYTLALLA